MSKILIVDDEEHIRISLKRTLKDLQKKNVEFFYAADGEEALDAVNKENPDLIFLDVMMPKKDGYDVCNTVKNVMKLKNTYIIILSAKGQEVDKEKGTQSGADLYITKPYKPAEIKELAEKILHL